MLLYQMRVLPSPNSAGPVAALTVAPDPARALNASVRNSIDAAQFPDANQEEPS